MATEDEAYRQSTQYRLWSFSPTQLHDLRSKTNALAKASISERLLLASQTSQTAAATTTSSSAPSSDPNTPAESANAGAASNPLPEFLTPAEEQQLVNFYTVELLRAGKFTEQPTDVQATAAVFLRRFYVTNSIMTYPPTEMLKTALFFGAKSEGFYHKLDGFADKFPNTKSADILAGEFLLCQGIRFSFDVRHPFRGLEGIIMELRRYGDIDDNRIAEAHRRAREILKFSPLVTDAYFHYTPSQMMFAALSLADRGLVERVMQETFRHLPGPKSSESGASTPAEVNANGGGGGGGKVRKADLLKEQISGAEVRDKVLATIESCREMLATEPPERFTEYWGKPESNNIIKPLLKKLKKCRDPDRWNLVALQRAKKESSVKSFSAGGGGAGSLAEDGAVFGMSDKAVTADARDPKRRKIGGRGALEDPFGPPLR